MTIAPQPAAAAPSADSDSGAASWRESLARHEQPTLRGSLLDLATSVLPYLSLTVAMYICLDVSAWIALALAIPAAGFLMRTFIVFHDCAHGSFFANRRANRWVGRFAGLLVFQPFANWRHNHAVHHGTAGDLDRRGTGDIATLTVEEYLARPWKSRLAYRMFRSPVVMFGIGPVWSLMIGPRLWSQKMRPRQRHSVIATNLALAIVIGAIFWFVGPRAWLLVQLPTAILAGTLGVWMFYVQHQFEDVYWETSERWSYAVAALRGSSYLKLPRVFQFFTGNIGLHHVHHLSAKIPNYNLQRAHDENPIFDRVPVLTAADGMRALRLKVIDPASGKLLTWSEVRALSRRPGLSAR
ncbi:MAG TPA: fatty acid desaturase [Solirubrobacterales bacterium]|nr:fatty acid desaturase [Solirubrobacterales bacterium]